MDLGAYANIESLNEIMKINDIDVPRLRGLRLMKDEEPITMAKLEDTWEWIGISKCEGLCENGFKMNGNLFELSDRTDKIKNKYLVKDKNNHPIGIKWDKVHGKKRKLFKYEMRKAKERVLKQYEIFNKYCGMDDILYIHARIGGHNWEYYQGDELAKQSWFLEKVDDAFDSTYCDIYASIEIYGEDTR